MEFPYAFMVVIYLLVILLFSIISKLKSLEKRFKNTEFMLKQIANQIGVAEHPTNEKLRQLLHEGRDVEAVKKARECFGYSLLEAKKYVDELKPNKEG